MNLGRRLMQGVTCIAALAFAGMMSTQADAAIYNTDIAKALSGSADDALGNVILIQRGERGGRGAGRSGGGGGGGGRAIGGGGGGRSFGGGGRSFGGGGGGSRIINRGPSGGGSFARVPRNNPSFRRDGGNFNRGPVIRRDTRVIGRAPAFRRGDGNFRRGPGVRRPVAVRHWGPRGRRYWRGGRWWFWAPWVGSYVYFNSYQSCYDSCRYRGYDHFYCEDLCYWN